MGYTPPWLLINRIAGPGWQLMGPGIPTGERLTIVANTADVYPEIKLIGAGDMTFSTATTQKVVIANSGVGAYLGFIRTGTDAILNGETANDNIFLSPTGTGKVKFGTFTGSGDVAVNGSISILDSGGSARKLATVA